MNSKREEVLKKRKVTEVAITVIKMANVIKCP